MNGFLIDTNVVSEYVREGGPDRGVWRWLESTDPAKQYVSVLTLAEIQKGVELLAMGRKRRALEQWLEKEVPAWFAGRILPVDQPVASGWASLTASLSKIGRPAPVLDSLIAATALVHDLTVVSRNVADFGSMGVSLVNPWSAHSTRD